jgi:hypothetical protein
MRFFKTYSLGNKIKNLALIIRKINVNKKHEHSPFLHFFTKIELFCRKRVRINIFPGGIKNSAKIGQKESVNLLLPKKGKNRQKKGYVLGKTPFLSSFLHFFKKIELFRRKTVRINIFPGGIKNSAKIGQKKSVNLILPKKG